MLERFDRIDSQNKMTQDLPERNKKNSLVTGLQNKQLDSHLDQKEAIFKNEIQENINAHQFLENTKLHSDQEVCKGCNLF